MQRLAEIRRANRPGAPSYIAEAPAGTSHFSTAGVAPSAQLIAPGCVGLTIPRLDGAPIEQQLRRGDRDVAVVAANVLRAGIGCPEDWPKSAGDPGRFLKLTLDRWVAAHSGDPIRQQFELSLILSTELDRCSSREPAGGVEELYLLLEPGSAGYVVLGPTIKLLERIHPRLPATFFSLFIGALNRWVRVYDYRDAEGRVEMLREWYEGDPEAENYELPDVAGGIPRSIRRRPLSKRAVERLIESGRNRQANEIMARALEVAKLAERAQRPEIGQKACEAMVDWNPPLPALLAVFHPGDAIEGCFDDESQTMMEVYPEPTLILPLNGRDPGSITATFRVLGVVCQTLWAASCLVKSLPGNDR